MAIDLRIDKLTATSDPDLFTVSNEITNFPKTITGVSKLAQIVEKMLLTTPGTDVFSPDIGGGIKSLLNKNVTQTNMSTIIAKIVTAISAIKDQIMDSQSEGNLPLDEQLKDLYLIDANTDISGPTIRISIGIVSKSDKQAVSILP